MDDRSKPGFSQPMMGSTKLQQQGRGMYPQGFGKKKLEKNMGKRYKRTRIKRK